MPYTQPERRLREFDLPSSADGHEKSLRRDLSIELLILALDTGSMQRERDETACWPYRLAAILQIQTAAFVAICVRSSESVTDVERMLLIEKHYVPDQSGLFYMLSGCQERCHRFRVWKFESN